jgi:hypothetical protein
MNWLPALPLTVPSTVLDQSGAQPFKVVVHSNVLLVCDFHAHLATTEIIGFLAGTWNDSTKGMRSLL